MGDEAVQGDLFKARFHFPNSLACLHHYLSTAMALRFHVFFFLFIASILLLSHTAKAGADAEDKLLDGINKYRASSNLSPLTQNKNAECLADQIAQQFEKQDCSNTTGANTVPGTENQFPNYPNLLDHCSLNITTTKDGLIMPACVPDLESNLVLSNFTKSQYSVNLNDSKYTGVGLASEDNWIVVVLTTASPTGNFAPASNVAGLVLKVGSHCYFLSFLLGFLMVLMS